MRKEDFLQNICRRLGRPAPMATAPERSAIGAPEFWQAYSLSVDERIERFQKELEALGGQVTVVKKLSELQMSLAARLEAMNPARIGTWGGDALGEFQLDSVLAPYEHVAWGPDQLPVFEQVDVGITGCAYAVADTGTLVMTSDVLRGRSVSVLPSVHIALVHANQLYTKLGDVMELLSLKAVRMPASVHFITGPSRSSDIENDQTIGIHGPAAVHVFVLRQESSGL